MQTKIFTIGDLKNGINKTWNYPRLQINITEENASFLPSIHKEFKMQLKFSNGEITNEKGLKYVDGTFLTTVVNDQPNRFGKGTVNAICAIWKDNKQDGILAGWLKDHDLKAGNKVKITLLNNETYLLEN